MLCFFYSSFFLIERVQDCRTIEQWKKPQQKKGFYKYMGSKRKSREDVDLLLNGAGDLMATGMEKAVVLSAFFASVFTDKSSCQALETRGKDCSREDLPSVEEDQAREQARHTSSWGLMRCTHKCRGSWLMSL